MTLRTLLLAGTAALALAAAPLVVDLESPWSRVPTRPEASPGATVAQVVGTNTWVQIAYHRPSARGRDVWTAKSSRGNAIVPSGGLWRAGANERTTLETSGDLLIAGEKVPAGRYGLFFVPGDDAWTLVLNEAADGWGTGGYDEAADVLRVELEPTSGPFTESLMFGFDAVGEGTARAFLRWTDVEVPFTVATSEG